MVDHQNAMHFGGFSVCKKHCAIFYNLYLLLNNIKLFYIIVLGDKKMQIKWEINLKGCKNEGN